jgi:hypothetical protein
MKITGLHRRGKKEKKKSSAQDDIVSNAVAELEALAPSQIRFVFSLCS